MENSTAIIKELSNQMIDNNVAWKNLKKRLCKEIKNILVPRSIGSIEETIDLTVEDLRLSADNANEELILRVSLLDRDEEISFLDMMKLDQLFNGGIGAVRLQPSEGILRNHPNHNLSFTLTLKRNEETVEQPVEKEEEVEQPESAQG